MPRNIIIHSVCNQHLSIKSRETLLHEMNRYPLGNPSRRQEVIEELTGLKNTDVGDIKALLSEMTELRLEELGEVEFQFVNDRNYVYTSFKKKLGIINKSFLRICDAYLYKLKTQTESEENKRIVKEIELVNLYVKQLTKDCQKSLDDNYTTLTTSKRTVNRYQDIYEDYLRHLVFVLNEHLNLEGLQLLSAAEEYEVLATPKAILVTITSHQDPVTKENNGNLFQIEIPQAPLDENMADEYLRAKPKHPKQPQWYKCMPEEERLLFDYAMKDIHTREKLMESIGAIPSRQRNVVGIANFSLHKLGLIDKEKQIAFVSPDRYRSSMIAPRDLYKLELYEEAERITRVNFIHIINTFLERKLSDPETRRLYMDESGELDPKKLAEIPILFQTLISPMIEPDKSLYADKQNVVTYLRKWGLKFNHAGKEVHFYPNIINTNHPLNIARHIYKTGSWASTLFESGDTMSESLKLVELAEKYVKQNPPVSANAVRLSRAAEELKQLLENPPRGRDNAQRELHLAALEEVIVQHLGGLSYGSCVSGKDRKGLETYYVDAMDNYFYHMHDMPRLHDTATRELFTDMYASQYVTYHQQVNAGQNSPGAEGIKTPVMYLPRDIQAAIRARSNNNVIFSDSDSLASNNDPEAVLKGRTNQFYYTRQLKTYESEFSEFMHELAGKRDLQAKVAIESVVGKLFLLLNRSAFSNQGTGFFLHKKEPDGIAVMRKVMEEGRRNNRDASMVLYTLANIATRRLAVDKYFRTSMTIDLYRMIIGLYNNPQSEKWLTELDKQGPAHEISYSQVRV